MAKWESIKTAPKDGTRYLGWGKRVGFMLVNEPPGCMRGSWTRTELKRWAGSGNFNADKLTHWQALPSPPGTQHG